MDQRVILAVAGSGKTSFIVDSIDPRRSNLVITYTDNNYRNLRSKIIRKYGSIPAGTRIYTYFSFLYSFCLRPFCGDVCDLKGVNFDVPPDYTRRLKRSNLSHYIDSNRRIYASRIASLIFNFEIAEDVQQRIKKYFDAIYVDEVQDFAGNDFNLLLLISNSIDAVLVGDFFQHTYDTSRDGNINNGLHDDYTKYKQAFGEKGFDIDETALRKSYRCSPTTCEFVSRVLGISIDSHHDRESLFQFVDDEMLAESIFHRTHTVKLFYQSHSRYPCNSENWGASKGIDDYDSVCVVLNNSTEQLFRAGQLSKLPPITRNKLYVACTRARSELLLVPERYVKKYKR
ncbi:MAG: DNA helicase UvrD [Pseudomonadota bacterium]|nr:DNA helicase UvrD [Pseudomonadota bacterium]